MILSDVFLILLVCLGLVTILSGYPVGLSLGGSAVLIAFAGWGFGAFDPIFFFALPARLFGVVTSSVLLAIPLFVLMGVILEKSGIAARMFDHIAWATRHVSGGLALSVTLVGTLMAASTGIVGASVVTLGMIALPALLRAGTKPSHAAGSVLAAGTLGQIIPPSIMLIVLGDQMSIAYQNMQGELGIFGGDTISVSDLFAGSLVPGLLLASVYLGYQLLYAMRASSDQAQDAEIIEPPAGSFRWSVVPPVLLILVVLGSILFGVASPTEAASLGVLVAMVLAVKNSNITTSIAVLRESVTLVAIIFLIVIGASVFALVFRGLGGDERVTDLLQALPGGTMSALACVLLLIFFLGFILEFLEITFIVVPIFAPVLLAMPLADGQMMDPLWLGILFALVLQTSFLTPPMGVSLFYLASVAPAEITSRVMYRGVAPFIVLQLLVLALVITFPSLATFLPSQLFER